MNYTHAVEIAYRVAKLECDLPDSLMTQIESSIVQIFEKIAGVAILHHDKNGFKVFKEIKNLDNIWMLAYF